MQSPTTPGRTIRSCLSACQILPYSCTIRLDRRIIPDDQPETVKGELRAVIESVDVSPASIAIDGFLFSSWFDSSINSELAQIFLSSVRNQLDDDPGPVGYLPGSDAKHLMDRARRDMIIFGPGSYEVAHAFDEHVEIEALEKTTSILIDFVDKVFV